MSLYIYSLIWALTTALSKSVAGEGPFVYCTVTHTPLQVTKALINRNASGFLVMNTECHYLVFFYYASACNFLGSQGRVLV